MSDGVMNSAATRAQIQEALAQIPYGKFEDTSKNLLKVLGYVSDRTLLEQTGEARVFVDNFPAMNAGTKSEQKFLEHVQSVYILFQITDSEIDRVSMPNNFSNPEGFDKGIEKSLMFASVEMTGGGVEDSGSYPRGIYADLAREINKRFLIPTVVLFKTNTPKGIFLTLAFVRRRPHQLDSKRDVLGTVSLVREIDTSDPHRAHVDILDDLSLSNRLRWVNDVRSPQNFDGLFASWLDALDTEELNRSFYRELLGWFESAVEIARFPTNQPKTISSEEHTIRLITRLLFVWFIKQKNLVADELFIEEHISSLIKGYDRDTGDSYYRAILQNLFFGTLNTEIHKRGFSQKRQSTHRNFQYYRFENEIADKDSLLELFSKTPFINGGLFDCLDSFEGSSSGGWRIDCFSDNVINPAQEEYRIVSVPNRLFFGEDGLIKIFNGYKFTVEENTPVEQEVALDPELLGKVFENLLAAHNPETKVTARKQSGSYYTPRLVVDYMVDEVLVAFLSEKVHPTIGNLEDWKIRLKCLFYYSDAFDEAGELFDKDEAHNLYHTITKMRILDPAVGSGAFPMSILLKMTLAMRRLSPNDFSSELDRKLYLIQNNIFGVDIQSMAIQISKLRVFISLAVEQEVQYGVSNYGIRPLPNLETKFVTSNFLIGLSEYLHLYSASSQLLEQQIRENRMEYFHASTRDKKIEHKRVDTDLRKKLAEKLEESGFPADDASKVASWDPYDQSMYAEWFDSRYMFGVENGFDIIIANPPYVESRNRLLSDKLKDLYGQQIIHDWHHSLPRGSDLLIYFYTRSARLLHDSGYGCFITQNAWLSTNYGKKFQDFSLGRLQFHSIIDTSSKFFSESSVQNINTIITIFSIRGTEEPIDYGIVDETFNITSRKSFMPRHTMKWGHIIGMPDYMLKILSDMSKVSDPAKTKYISFGQGVNPPKANLNIPDATIPILVNSCKFVACDADSLCSRVDIKRDKIPALVMPRGIGERHYCTFNQCRAFSYSGVELYLPVEQWGSDIHYCLWIYLNSSFVWLYREITGRKNLGGGMLKAEATDMKNLPVGFSFDFTNEAKRIFKNLSKREPMKVEDELYTDDHLLIDEIVSDYFGFTYYQDSIRETLIKQVTFRTTRSRR